MIRYLILLFSFSILLSGQLEAQTQNASNLRKGKFFASWGWNWSAYSKSDIHFTGADYDFTLLDVKGEDDPVPFSIDKYANIKKISVPQYNFRMGYFFKENYSISIAWDHMKYVAPLGQTVKISGKINAGTSYDGTYKGDNIVIADDLVIFEHTNGLNIANVELRRYDQLWEWRKMRVELIEGVGIGAMVPRTDATIFGKENADKFYFSGYEINLLTGVKFSIGKNFFAQSEVKVGRINMQNILTTISSSDRADQKFWFYQLNVVFGATMNFKKNK